jgi:molybdenum cofactor biosynthesis enzyme MoaA
MKDFPVELRVAVASGCQMRCIYCPTSSFENYTPVEFRKKINFDEGFFIVLKTLLMAKSFKKISLTGGEPLLNPLLPDIIKMARHYVPRIELNTNGLLLDANRWEKLNGLIDQVKISIDTLNPLLFSSITKVAGDNSIKKILNAIEILKESRNVEVVLNTVLMKNNFESVFQLIEFVKNNNIRLHILDFNYTEERREIWNQDFIPSEYLIEKLSKIYGPYSKIERVGAGYFEFHLTDKCVVRIRSSHFGTFRTQRCNQCSHYCQTGIFGLMLSTDGWLTTCQASYDKKDGVLLEPEMSVKIVQEKIAWLVNEIISAKYTDKSFETLIERQKLKPINL